MNTTNKKTVNVYSKKPDYSSGNSIGSSGISLDSLRRSLPLLFPGAVKTLREQKYKIKIQHFRVGYKTGERNEKPSYYRIHEIKNILPRGGKTIMEIESPDGRFYTTESICSKRDTFCYKLGVQECLKKILPVMKNSGENFDVVVNLEALAWLK